MNLKNKKFYFLLIFVVVLVVFFIIAVSGLNSKKEKIDINSGVVQSLFSTFRLDDGCYLDVKDLNDNNQVKLKIAYDAIPQKSFSSIECSKLTIKPNEGLRCNVIDGVDNTISLDSKILEAKVHELFGTNYKYVPEAFGLVKRDTTCNSMYYDEKNSIFAEFYGDCNISCYERSQKIKEAYKVNNKLYIVTNYKYSVLDEKKNKIDNKKSIVTYRFKWDKGYERYVFDKVSEK